MSDRSEGHNSQLEPLKTWGLADIMPAHLSSHRVSRLQGKEVWELTRNPFRYLEAVDLSERYSDVF